ncbi:PH domain-containing protein [bacterium]|nr:PH domain-containing protein [bacterium]
MELRPDIQQLMWREVYTLLTISLVIIVCMLILQVLVVTFDPDVDNAQFVKYGWSWAAGVLIALWIFVPWILYFWIINLKYSIEDDRLVIQKGIITKKNVSIPYMAITDFTLSRSLYERWLGIATLLIQTAGQSVQASGYEGKLEGLNDFDNLHAVLRAKVKAFRGVQDQQAATISSPVSDEHVLQELLEEVKQINRKLN